MDNNNSKMSNDEIVKRIVQLVAIAENVSVDDIYGDAKSIDVSQARAMCMYITNKLTDCDYETIGNMFNKHHSTVIYNIEKIKMANDEDLEFKNKIKSIINNVQNKAITTLTLKYTFDNFVVKTNNRLAFIAARNIALTTALEPSKTSELNIPNPLLIYGEKTSGKTHLLNAIKNEIKNRKSNLQVAFVDENNPISRVSINADVLLVDDVQLYMNDEFFNIYNSFITSRKQVVLTADKPYSEFVDGLLADIQPVEFETKSNTTTNQSVLTEKSLNGIYETFSELIGFENTQKLYEVFKGREIAFPVRLFSNQTKSSTK